jgi:hypothetical protein
MGSNEDHLNAAHHLQSNSGATDLFRTAQWLIPGKSSRLSEISASVCQAPGSACGGNPASTRLNLASLSAIVKQNNGSEAEERSRVCFDASQAWQFEIANNARSPRHLNGVTLRESLVDVGDIGVGSHWRPS